MSDDVRLQDARKRGARIAANKAMREQVAQQADQIAALLKIAPEEVLFDRDGVQLTPMQGEQLLSLALVGYTQIYQFRYVSDAKFASCVNCGKHIVGTTRTNFWAHMATNESYCADNDLIERGLNASKDYYAMPSQKGVLPRHVRQ